MSFETAADSFIRPRIAAQATPAFAVRQVAETPQAGAAQSALRGPGGNEIGRQGGVETERRDDLTFDDLLDLVNPLHHIPVIGTLYRKMTGDEIKAPAQVLGGLLYGGPVGMVAAATNAVIEEAAGGDIGDAVYAMVFGPDEGGATDLAATDLAATDPATVAAAAQAASATAPAAGPATTLSAPLPSAPPPAAPSPDAAAVAATASDPGAPAAGDPVAPDDAAHLPPVPAGALTGKAALDAFLNDLAGVGRAAQAAGTPAEAALQPPALQAPPAAAQAVAPAAAQGTPQQVSARPNPAASDKPAAAAHEATPAGAASVPPNLQDLGPRDRRGTAKPAPILPDSLPPRAKASRTDARAEPGITITPGRASAGVDPRFLAPASDPGTPLIDTGSGGGDFSQQMLQALQKYEDMLTARRSNARS